jgi:hypothetical protein
MKGDRNKLRALEAKARFGEGSERASARKLLAKIRYESPAIRVDNLPYQEEEVFSSATRGVSMDMLLNEYGDALQEHAPKHRAFTWVAVLVCLFLAWILLG